MCMCALPIECDNDKIMLTCCREAYTLRHNGFDINNCNWLKTLWSCLNGTTNSNCAKRSPIKKIQNEAQQYAIESNWTKNDEDLA